MKRIIVLFLCMYTLTFSIVDFENLRWNDKVFDIMLAYPGVHEEESFQDGVEVYVLDNPRDYVASYNFYLIDGSLYKIEIIFDNERVGRSEIRDIYDTIVSKMGDPISRETINKDLVTTKQTGNSQVFRPDKETMAFFKGIDTIDKDGNMIDSKLLIEYRNVARLNIP